MTGLICLYIVFGWFYFCCMLLAYSMLSYPGSNKWFFWSQAAMVIVFSLMQFLPSGPIYNEDFFHETKQEEVHADINAFEILQDKKTIILEIELKGKDNE